MDTSREGALTGCLILPAESGRPGPGKLTHWPWSMGYRALIRASAFAFVHGNVRRAIDLHERDKLNESAFKDLIRAAIVLNLQKRSKPSRRWRLFVRSDHHNPGAPHLEHRDLGLQNARSQHVSCSCP